MATAKLTTVIIDALEDIKARDIKLINVAKLTSVFDYIAIASADSTRQTKALAKNVMDKVKESGGWIYGIEGEQSGEWVLVDCGDVVVHIMQPVIREHYKLEELWGEGKLEYPRPVAKRRPAAKPTATAPDAAKSPKPKAKVKSAAKAKITATANAKTTSKTAKPKSVKATTASAKTKAGTGKKAVAKTTPVTKTTVKKAAPIVKKRVAPTTKKAVAKKTATKKPAARKPVAGGRKSSE